MHTYLVLTIAVLFMLWMMGRTYGNESYVCPTCGATDEDAHADECPWKR